MPTTQRTNSHTTRSHTQTIDSTFGEFLLTIYTYIYMDEEGTYIYTLLYIINIPSHVCSIKMISLATFFPCSGTVLHRTTKPFLIAP